MKYVSWKDRYSCRRVCQQWAVTISSFFIRPGMYENSYVLDFTYDKSRGDYVSIQDENWTLEDFNKPLWFKKPWPFPCIGFYFTGGSLNSPNVRSRKIYQGMWAKFG